MHLDANSIIYSVELIAPYHGLLLPVWQAAPAQSIRLVTSELSLLEVLVGPLKAGNMMLEAGYRRLLQSASDVASIPISMAILERAAALRATTSVKTPDAIHAATALEHGSALFVTNDPAFRRVPGLQVTLLDDLLAP